MRYTVTFLEDDYEQLTGYLFSDRKVERAAYALCKISVTNGETRLLVRSIIPVSVDDIEEATETEIIIKNRSFLRVMKEADQTKQLFVFIHSHPSGYINYSTQDNEEETKLFRTAYNRISTTGVHGSLLLSDMDKPVGRIWLESGENIRVDLIRVIGSKFRFYSDLHSVDSLPTFFDRQIRAFGEDIQRVLKVLNVGIVGVGGTGSAVMEQLIRLGVGTITIIDGQKFEESNVNRIYGSSVHDKDVEKVVIAENNSDRIGLQTRVISFNKPISFLSASEKLRDCDIIFGCTDDHWGRSILNRLSVYYSIPVFDMGVRIHSIEGELKSVQGRVTTLLGGYACLFCRDRIDYKQIEAEMLHETDPEKYFRLQKERYADELEGTAPSVIPFTTNIATLAISEFIHRLTGFMGEFRITNEVLMLFDDSKIMKNHRPSKEECYCGNRDNIQRGDSNPLLGLIWRQENADN